MGGDSKSKSSQESTNVDQTFNFVEGTGDGDRANFALSEGARVGDVNISKTDYGALEAAAELNRNANDLAMTSAERAFDTADNFAGRSFDALKYGQDFAKDLSLTTSELVFDAANNFAGKSFDALTESQDFAKDLNNDSLNFASSTLSEVLSAAADQQSATRDQTDRQVEKAFQLATTHSRSEGGEALQGAVKIGMVGVGLFGSAYLIRQLVNQDKK